MCLGLAARVIGPDDSHADLAVVDIAGVHRTINVSLLDRSPAEVMELATEASKQGWLRLKAAGSVIEITFPGLLKPAEERLAHEPN